MRKAIKIIAFAALFICLTLGIAAGYPYGEKSEAKSAAIEATQTARADFTEIKIIKAEENTYSYEYPEEIYDDPTEDEDTAIAGDEENGFSEAYQVIMNHISEILSLAAFIGSLICAVIYKSGLMPLMNNSLNGLKSIVAKIKESADKAESDNKESIGGIEDRIAELEDSISDMSEAFMRLSESIEGYDDQRAHRMRLDTILEGELEMLYDIFMTSSLPEYEKARVGERMRKLREVLNSDEQGEK